MISYACRQIADRPSGRFSPTAGRSIHSSSAGYASFPRMLALVAAAAFGLLVAAPPRAAHVRATVPRCIEVAAADALSQSPALLATAGTAVAAIGGILINNQQKKKPAAAVPKPAAAEVAEVAPPAPKPSTTTAYRGKVPALCCRRSTPILCMPPPPPQHQPVRTLPSLQVTVGFHRGAGRMPPTPAREQWEPPPGWAPPSKPVTSWYDRGDRLAISAPPPEAAAAPAASPNLLEQFVALFSGVSASASASAAPRASAYKGKV